MRYGDSSVSALLSGYQPRSADERADLERIRALASIDDPWSRMTLPLHFTASALVVHPPTRRILLRWHARQRGWLQVGGHADPGEVQPIDVAVREGREETGLTDLVCWPDASLRQVAVVSVPARGAEPQHEHADLRFVLATGAPDAARPENSAAPLRWLTLPEAYDVVAEPNLRAFVSRVDELFDEGHR